MVEVFITDIQGKIQSDQVVCSIRDCYPELKINIDLNETEKSYPCGHTVLRVEGNTINPGKILTTVRDLGYRCVVMENKICV
ncbi:hypothetical protein ACFSKL_07600 [Belliella marina]|uniref:Copper chaperone CopZ n=1 Tax=Belliella marina TaxID=1644146 RepID=A0ABW4VLU7_9BACT